MKNRPLLNSQISRLISEMGHTQLLCVGDAGLPVPSGPERIDMALTHGIPAFMDTLDVILTEFEVESIILAEEIREHNPAVLQGIIQRFPGIPVTYIAHEDFKKKTALCRAVIRTGEVTPYANIILQSGVVF